MIETPRFPVPFAGCVRMVQFESRERLFIAMTALEYACPLHDHNFAISTSPPRIYCSELAVECLRRADAL